MTNGRDKGTRGERAVAGIMREWWKSHEPTAQFIRTPLSGGWQHGAPGIAAHFKACGDLMSTSQSFPFCVEVKWRENWSVDNFLDGKPNASWGWWKQACEAALKQGSIPMMWMRRNRIPFTSTPFPWVVIIPRETVSALVLDAPDMNWELKKMRVEGVDVDVEPAGYDYKRFLLMDPRRMIQVKRGGHVNA